MMNKNRILLVSPVRPSLSVRGRPHLGIGLLCARLMEKGYEVKILDYIVDPALPSLKRVMDSFQPATVGVTINTAVWSQVDEMLDVLMEYDGVKRLAGGPHATLYSEDLKKDPRLHYVFRGESEESVVEVCENAALPDSAVVIEPSKTQMDKIIIPAFEACVAREKIESYPIQTSRGCPFGCIFCEVSDISSKKWRPRPVNQIIEELKTVRGRFPGVKTIDVVDDNPGFKKDHFKAFLSEYMEFRGDWELRVDNIRADSIDAEMVSMLKQSNCVSICLGVEHGNPEIFKSVNKGETHEQIQNAARLINEAGLRLGMCFVIGLPGDSLEKTRDSVQFAKDGGAQYMFWNILVPHKGTKVRKWIEERGTIDDEVDFTSIVDNQIHADRPVFETDSFSRKDIIKTHFWAVLSTNNYGLNKKNLWYVVSTAIKYGFVSELLKSLFVQTRRRYFS